jgi:hypothetical protein
MRGIHAVAAVFALLVAFAASARADDDPEADRNPWKADGWYGADSFDLGKFQSCTFQVDFPPHSNFSIQRFPGNALSQLWLTDEAPGIDWDNLNSAVTLSVGGAARTYKLDQNFRNWLDFTPEAGFLDKVAAGGTLSLRLSNGKTYSVTMPPAPTALANYRKCMARYRLPGKD